jgi:DNA-binding IscR family transcriptional regulator
MAALGHIRFDEYFVRHKLCNLSGTSFKVLAVILIHYNRKSCFCYPTEKTIALLAGISTRQCKRAIQELADKGFLTIERGKPNRYSLGRELLPKGT